MLSQAKREFIEFMMSADVLRFGSFVTKSGRQTPYFVNTGNYKTGAQISRLGEFYAQLVKETVGEDFDAMFGPAYKGIPLVTSAAGALARNYGMDKPYFFNRKEAKDHGEGGSLVGYKPMTTESSSSRTDYCRKRRAGDNACLEQCAKVSVPDMSFRSIAARWGRLLKTAIMEAMRNIYPVHALRQWRISGNISRNREPMARFCLQWTPIWLSTAFWTEKCAQVGAGHRSCPDAARSGTAPLKNLKLCKKTRRTAGSPGLFTNDSRSARRICGIINANSGKTALAVFADAFLLPFW
ncbi:MAG: hypothetical protein ACLRVT_01040 [Oscillospiraceae bacterium]